MTDAPPASTDSQRGSRSWNSNAGSTERVHEIRPFLDILETKLHALALDAQVVLNSTALEGFGAYVRLRNLLSECRALIIIIEERVRQAREMNEPVDVFEEKLALLTTRLWETLLGTALHFFRQISHTPELPLGSRDVFMRELQTLHEARKTLRQEPFTRHVQEGTLDDLDLAEKLLREIIERAPGLLELG